MSDPDRRHQVVIVGGGFGGLQAVRSLRGAPVEVTLVDRRSFHLFQPLLYQKRSRMHDRSGASVNLAASRECPI